MTRIALLSLPVLFLLPAVAPAQELRSGPGAPAVSSQIPPTTLPNEGAERSGAAAPNAPGASGGAGDPGTQRTDHIRGVQPSTGGPIGDQPVPGADRRPPADHQVLGAPPVPGATQPRSSEGFFTNRDVIPPNIGARIRPDAPTTDTGQRARSGQDGR